MPNSSHKNTLIRQEIEISTLSEMNPNAIGPYVSEKNRKTKSKIVMHIYNYLKDVYTKILRYKNDIKSIEVHLRTKTTPESLYYCNFPQPLLKYDARYVEIYNTIICETQIRIMVETIHYLNKCIKKLEDEAATLKKSLSHFVADVDERVKTIYQKEVEKIAQETANLVKLDTDKPEFNMTFYRAYRNISKPYVAEQVILNPPRRLTAHSKLNTTRTDQKMYQIPSIYKKFQPNIRTKSSDTINKTNSSNRPQFPATKARSKTSLSNSRRNSRRNSRSSVLSDRFH